MKKIIFAVLAGSALVLAGCVKTVTDNETLATTFGKDTLSNRYARPLDQAYQASLYVINHDGVLVTEYIPHDTTNAVRSLTGRINDRKVWIRCEAVTPTITQVDVQARTKWGVSDIELSHEVATEISLRLAQQ